MICITSGTVTALEANGFRIAAAGGHEQRIRTMTPGALLALSVGDRVRVYGGPGPDGAFATSSIAREAESGESVPIPDAPRIPPDFLVTYEWMAAPLPPPHHWRFDVSIAGYGLGEVCVVPGYAAPDVPEWRERFLLLPAHLEWLCQVMLDRDVFAGPWPSRGDPSVGGSSECLTVRSNGIEIEIPGDVDEHQGLAAHQLFAAVRALIPPDLWSCLDTRRQAYAKASSVR